MISCSIRLQAMLAACLVLGCPAWGNVRAAIDLGSGGPKIQVAAVNIETCQITDVLYRHEFAVPFQASLQRNAERSLSAEVIAEGIDALRCAAAIAEGFGADKTVVVATAAFRKASNGDDCINKMCAETGLEIAVIDALLEGALAFYAAAATTHMATDTILVWDIGGGSTQFVHQRHSGELAIETTHAASGFFRDYIIHSIQRQPLPDVLTPNPMSNQDIEEALSYAIGLSQSIHPEFKEKAMHSSTKVVGVGSALKGVSKTFLNGRTEVSAAELATVLSSIAGKDDVDYEGKYPCVEGSNAILTLGFMLGLGIDRMQICDVNNTDGVLLHPAFWD